MQKKFNELKEKSIGNGPLQGEKHIIWDTLSIEITKFRHYLNFIDDLSILTDSVQQKLKLVNEHMAKRPHYSSERIKFSEFTDIPKVARHIKDRISIVLWAKKIIHKHHLMKTVQDKSEEFLV